MSTLAKQNAAAAALAFVEPGMTLGLGTGSTAKAFITMLGERVRAGLDVVGIPTSTRSDALARDGGIPIITPDETTTIDLAIDGADEATPAGALIKGGGGALLREKIIAGAAQRFIVIADASKRVSRLGAFPLPIEITPYSYGLTVRAIRRVCERQGLRGDFTLRARDDGEGFFITDGGNYIVDAALGDIPEPAALDEKLTLLPGVVTTGLFTAHTTDLIFGSETGTEHLTVERPAR